MEAVAKDIERFCIFEDDLPRSGLELLYLLREITNHPFVLRTTESERV